MVKKNKLVKPYLKWAGGKRQLLSELEKYTPAKYNTYFEPFVGAGALFFNIQHDYAVINDANTELITTYKVIKNDMEELLKLLKNYEVKNNSDDFYLIRSMDRDIEKYNAMSDVEKAARLIYLNKTCYNGLYRVNSQGLFNTPFGSYKNPAICNENTIRAVNNYMNSAKLLEITNNDFDVCVKKAKEGDFVYFDPPYHSAEKTNFTGYQSGGFDEKEQTRLYDTFKALTDKNVKCMLSNSSTDFIKELYKEFRPKIVKATRAINSNKNGRGNVDEIIVVNYEENKWLGD